MSKITNFDKDILDGINVPTIDSNTSAEKTKTTEVNNVDEQNLETPTGDRTTDSLGENITDSADSTSIKNKLREALDAQSSFDSINNEDYIKAGTLTNSGLRLSDEEMEALLDSVDSQVERINNKAKQLKDAVIIRQQADPTVVEINPNQDELIKKGLVKVFNHKDNTITFEHYQAALEARNLLADKQANKQLKNSEVLFRDRDSQ